MKCFKCGKEMDREDGGTPLQGIEVTIEVKEDSRSQADIDYYNTQMGKYSDGNGECHVAICYECHIDGLFNLNFTEVRDSFKREYP